MADNHDPFANPRDLFLRPYLFIVHSDADEDDRLLARQIAARCEDFCRPQCGTVAELRRHSVAGRSFLGMTLVILSPAMLASQEGRAALVRQMQPAFYQSLFRHYCVCRSVPAESLQAYPEIVPLLDNVMAGDAERSLPAILADMRDFVTRVMPAAPELAHPVSRLLYRQGLRRTLAAFALVLAMLVGRVSSLAKPAAAVLALAWWQQWSLPGAPALVAFVAFYAGYRLNHLQGGDLWPWLGRSWKLPHHHSIGANNTPRRRLMAIGPLSIVGVIVALQYDLAFQSIEATTWVVLGLVTQSVVDYANTRHLAAGLDIGVEAERTLGTAEAPEAAGARLSFQDLARKAGGVIATFYGGAVLTLALSAIMLVPGYLVSGRQRSIDVVWMAIAAGLGYLCPGLLERFVHSGITYLGEYVGLSSADDRLFKKLAGASNPKLTVERHVPADEHTMVEAFAADDRPLVLQWLNNLRIGWRPRAFRRWSPSPDFAFISYAWRDNAETSAADGVSNACVAAKVESFLDKVMLQSGEGLFRMPLAAGLSKSTHVFLVVTPGVAHGQVVRREIEMAMGRWGAEFLPAIICVVEPDVCAQLLADPAVPLPIRFLLTFCPQMTQAEAAQPALVKYVVEMTRREGKWNDWRLLLSPSTALAQVIRMPGIVPRGE